MFSRRSLFVGVLACCIFPPAAARPGEPAPGTTKERATAPGIAPSQQRLLPVWRALLLVYRQVEVDYKDDGGKPHHFSNKLPDDEVRAAVWSFRQHPSLAYKHSNGALVIQYDIVYPSRTVNSVTKMGKNAWWLSPDDTRPEIKKYAPKGSYDSILVLAPLSNRAKGQSVPTGGWGLAIGPSDWSSGASYCTVGNAPVDGWNEPAVGEVWLHEWLHGACAHFAQKGFVMPKGDSDAGGSHGYKHSDVEGWGEFYQDLMNGQVLDEGRRTGITQEAWQSGAICGKKQLVVADYFLSDTRSSFRTTGKAVWTGRGGKHENIFLGDPQKAESTLCLAVDLKNRTLLAARVQVPASGVGRSDSVGIALGEGKVQCCALLEYGTKWAGKTSVSIRSGQAPRESAPVSLAPGWYTVKLLVDPAAQTIDMKTWADGENEPPSWQLSGKLPSGWKAAAAGFKHVGHAVLVDDLVIVDRRVGYLHCRPRLVN